MFGPGRSELPAGIRSPPVLVGASNSAQDRSQMSLAEDQHCPARSRIRKSAA